MSAPIYRALTRMPLYGGVEKSVLMGEAASAAFVIYLFQFSWLSFAVISVLIAVIHPLLVKMYQSDECLPGVLYRHLAQKGRYAPYCISRRQRIIRSMPPPR